PLPISLRHGLFLAVGAALAQPALAEDAAVTTQLDAVTVQGEYIPEPMAQTAEVASFVSREDLQRTGDGDAAQALARVSGLSVVGKKYVYVRGLGEQIGRAHV